jgi:hypothetical protein
MSPPLSLHYTVKKDFIVFPLPSQDVTNQTPHGREENGYYLVISKPGTEKNANLFYSVQYRADAGHVIRTALTEEGETPEDLADPDDYQMLGSTPDLHCLSNWQCGSV